MLGAQAHQLFAGIGDGGGTGIRDQGAGLSAQKPLQNGLSGGDVIVGMIAHQRLFDFKMVEQLDGYPGILRRNKIYGLQGFHCPGREVSQVPDGGCHQV